MPEQEQGVFINCVYCQELNPEIKEKCPRCQGQINYFLPARMMDKFTANQDFLISLMDSVTKIQAKKPDFVSGNFFDLSNDELATISPILENLVLRINIYNIKLKEALIQLYKQINQNEDIN